MCKAHFLVFCDRKIADTAIQSILEHDTRIEVVSNRTIECEDIDETTDVYNLRRGHEMACVAIIIGDRESQVGPDDGEYWIYVDGAAQGLFKRNESFARELTEILIANGGRESRKKAQNPSVDDGAERKSGAAPGSDVPMEIKWRRE